MSRFLILTRWTCRDNGRRLTFYRSHYRVADSGRAARAMERAHNATRTDMADEGWRSKVVHTVDLDADRAVYPTVSDTFEPIDVEHVARMAQGYTNTIKLQRSPLRKTISTALESVDGCCLDTVDERDRVADAVAHALNDALGEAPCYRGTDGVDPRDVRFARYPKGHAMRVGSGDVVFSLEPDHHDQEGSDVMFGTRGVVFEEPGYVCIRWDTGATCALKCDDAYMMSVSFDDPKA